MCDWIIKIIITFIITVIEIDGTNNVNFAGSKIEKISLIIKIWFSNHFKLWRLLV
jgi:hypothetical protein